jgi:hypothetical protein
MSKLLVVTAMALSVAPLSIYAQGRGGQAPATAQAAAPVDLTGYWVSVVTEDWRYRMVTPVKGDYPSIPLNPEGRKVADSWDPAKDEAAGNQCKSYGAGNVMRVPERLRITWDSDNTLKVDTDAAVPFWPSASGHGRAVVAGRFRRAVGICRRRPRAARPRGGRCREFEGGHHSHEARIPAKERRAL